MATVDLGYCNHARHITSIAEYWHTASTRSPHAAFQVRSVFRESETIVIDLHGVESGDITFADLLP